MMRQLVLLSVCFAALSLATKTGGKPEGVIVSDQEILARAQSQLLGAMALLEGLENKQEFVGEAVDPITAEKRRNKFEFIRFGRK